MKAIVLCVLLLAPLVLAKTQVQGDEFAKLKHMFAGLFSGGRMGANAAAAAPAAAAATPAATPAAAKGHAAAAATPAPAGARGSASRASTPDFETRHIPGAGKYLPAPAAQGGNWLKGIVVTVRTALGRRNRVCAKSRKLHKAWFAANRSYKFASRKLTGKQNYFNTVPITSASKYVNCVSFHQKRFDSRAADWQQQHPAYMTDKRTKCAAKITEARNKVLANLQSIADAKKAALDKTSEQYTAKKAKCKALHQSFRQLLQSSRDQVQAKKRTLATKKSQRFAEFKKNVRAIARLKHKLKQSVFGRDSNHKVYKRLVAKLAEHRKVLARLRSLSA